MISLALSIAKPRPSSEVGEAGAPAADGKRVNGAFSAVLASLGQERTAGEDDLTTAADSAANAAANGIALPVPAETGKILPDVAGTASGKGFAKAVESAEDDPDAGADAGSEAAVIAVPLVQLPAIPAIADAPVPAEAKPARPFAGPSRHVAAEGSPLPSSQPGAGGEQTEASSVALHVAPGARPVHASVALHVAPGARPVHASAAKPSPAPAEGAPMVSEASNHEGDDMGEAPAAAHAAAEAGAGRSGRRNARPQANVEAQLVKGRETSAEGMLIPRSASAEPAPQAPSLTFAQGLQAERTHAGRPLESAKPALQSDALQDLTRVVDRLAAAREAFAPAAAALAVKHAEFGDLSLRFEQQRDGQLAVQLSASDPEAHRAVAAAVSERGNAAPGDSQTGAGQSHAQSRGAASERDGNGSNAASGNAERRDQPQQRRPDAQAQPSGSTQRNGVFA